MSRLDALTAAIWDQALAGDLNAVDRVLKIRGRRSRYLGLDASKQIRVEEMAYFDTETIDVEVLRLFLILENTPKEIGGAPREANGSDTDGK